MTAPTVVVVGIPTGRTPPAPQTVLVGECDGCGCDVWAPLPAGLAGSLTSFTPLIQCERCFGERLVSPPAAHPYS